MEMGTVVFGDKWGWLVASGMGIVVGMGTNTCPCEALYQLNLTSF